MLAGKKSTTHFRAEVQEFTQGRDTGMLSSAAHYLLEASYYLHATSAKTTQSGIFLAMILIRPPRIKCKSRLVHGVASVEEKTPALCQLMTPIKSLPLPLAGLQMEMCGSRQFPARCHGSCPCRAVTSTRISVLVRCRQRVGWELARWMGTIICETWVPELDL